MWGKLRCIDAVGFWTVAKHSYWFEATVHGHQFHQGATDESLCKPTKSNSTAVVGALDQCAHCVQISIQINSNQQAACVYQKSEQCSSNLKQHQFGCSASYEYGLCWQQRLKIIMCSCEQ